MSGPFTEGPWGHNQRPTSYPVPADDDSIIGPAPARDWWTELAAALAYRTDAEALFLSTLRQAGQPELAAELAATIERVRL